MHRTVKQLLATALLAAAPLSQAGIITFDLSYSGSPFGNSASASGFVSFDDTVLPNAAGGLFNVSPAALGVVGWGLTVSGAPTGNGSFTLADLGPLTNGWVWSLSAPLDLAQDLVGQAGFSDFNWCAGSLSCGNSAAPGGVSAFTIATSGETGVRLILTSMQAVPEPGSLFLVGLALVAAAGARRGKPGSACAPQSGS